MKTKHTPGPWQIREVGPNAITITCEKGTIADVSIWSYGEAGHCDENRSNAARIVECVNAHDGLVERVRALEAALEAAVERMEAVAEGIPVENRADGVSQATHVRHMAGHLAQHAKIARAAIAVIRGTKSPAVYQYVLAERDALAEQVMAICWRAQEVIRQQVLADRSSEKGTEMSNKAVQHYGNMALMQEMREALSDICDGACWQLSGPKRRVANISSDKIEKARIMLAKFDKGSD